MARKPFVNNQNTLHTVEGTVVSLPNFSARFNRPLRDNKGAIVYAKGTARTYRRSFDGAFGRVNKNLIGIMSRNGAKKEVIEEVELDNKITHTFNPSDDTTMVEA